MPSLQLSIITPVFNTPATYLQALADSLDVPLGGDDAEWLLVDDGSDRADTRVWLDEVGQRPGVRLLANAGVKGAAGARNHAASLACGHWLFFIDADDVLISGALSRLLDSAKGDPAIRWLAGDFEQFEGDPPRDPDTADATPLMPPIEHWPDATDRLISETLFNQGSYLVERELFHDAGGFDPRFQIGEDWLLWMRMAIREELYYCNFPVFRQRRGHSSLMSGPLSLSDAIVAPYLAARRDRRFAAQKRLLRWRIFHLYRLLSERNQAQSRRFATLRFATLAAIWAINEPQQWANAVRALAGRPLRPV